MKLFKLLSYAKRNAYRDNVARGGGERLKNNLLNPSNIVASEETSNLLADTRGTRTVSNQDKVVNLFSDTGCIKNLRKEYSLGFVLTGESIFLHEEIKKMFKEEKWKLNQISKNVTCERECEVKMFMVKKHTLFFVGFNFSGKYFVRICIAKHILSSAN